jgi:hypothetical protein
MDELKVFWYMGHVLFKSKEKDDDCGLYGVAAELSKSKAVLRLKGTTDVTLKKYIKVVQELFEERDELLALLQARADADLPFLTGGVQGKQRKYLTWSDTAWRAWPLVGRYLRAMEAIT